LGISDETGNDRATSARGGRERRVIAQPKVVAQPDKDGLAHESGGRVAME
jgi:hypothetical protein